MGARAAVGTVVEMRPPFCGCQGRSLWESTISAMVARAVGDPCCCFWRCWFAAHWSHGGALGSEGAAEGFDEDEGAPESPPGPESPGPPAPPGADPGPPAPCPGVPPPGRSRPHSSNHQQAKDPYSVSVTQSAVFDQDIADPLRRFDQAHLAHWWSERGFLPLEEKQRWGSLSMASSLSARRIRSW